MKLKIRKMGINGEGIGYVDHKPVFVEGVLPYEEAEVEITERKIHTQKVRSKNCYGYPKKESVQTTNTILKKDVLYIFFNTRHSSNIKTDLGRSFIEIWKCQKSLCQRLSPISTHLWLSYTM